MIKCIAAVILSNSVIIFFSNVISAGSETFARVSTGEVYFSDPSRKRLTTVKALEGIRAFGGRIERANALSKREAGELRARWQRSEMIHQQRAELMKQFK